MSTIIVNNILAMINETINADDNELISLTKNRCEQTSIKYQPIELSSNPNLQSNHLHHHDLNNSTIIEFQHFNNLISNQPTLSSQQPHQSTLQNHLNQSRSDQFHSLQSNDEQFDEIIQKFNNFKLDTQPRTQFKTIAELDLHLSLQQWILKARIISKTNIMQYNTKNKKGCHMNINIVDNQGQQVSCCFFDNAALSYFEVLKVGQIYYFQKAEIIKIQDKYKQYCRPNLNQIQLIFNNYYCVVSNFSNIDQPSSFDNLRLEVDMFVQNSTVSLNAKVVSIQSKQFHQPEKRQSCIVILMGNQGFKVQMLFYDEHVQIANKLQIQQQYSFKNVFLKDDMGTRILMYQKGSVIYAQNYPEFLESRYKEMFIQFRKTSLKTRLDQQHRQKDQKTKNWQQDSQKQQAKQEQEIRYQSLREVLDCRLDNECISDQQMVFDCQGYLVGIESLMNSQKLYRLSCQNMNCRKTVEIDSYCQKCGRNVSSKWVYFFKLKVQDTSCTIDCRINDSAGQVLLRMDAQQFKDQELKDQMFMNRVKQTINDDDQKYEIRILVKLNQQYGRKEYYVTRLRATASIY